MPGSALVDSTNPLKRSRSAQFTLSGPAYKKQCSDDRTARCLHVEETSTDLRPPADLEKLLRRLAKSVDYATVKTLKGLVTGREQGVSCLTAMIQSLIEHVQSVVAKRYRGLAVDKKLLQAELYLEWLREYEFVLTAVEPTLKSRPGRRFFSILFHLIDQYISAVDAFQDGWHMSEPCSWVMTLVEEANDSSTDERQEAELDRFDVVMAQALQRYKAERPEYWRLSTAIGDKQETLARGCCLLQEQTGYGEQGYGGSEDMGLSLLFTTRDAMLEWKGQTAKVPENIDSGYETEL
ncbi:hypothetical protein B0H16DRAFT_1624957 [Mycena metata]|uniref:Uncharacterized protein n=1 Tax=Mycena metata TaxID=1033252 RepID=A0AAD7H5L4_9AGAR|nr:hypothetical protein B0H16DRAFT_1624957 [Mycena metata]